MSDESEFTVVAHGSALMMAPDAYINVNPGLFDAPPPMLLDDAAMLALAARNPSSSANGNVNGAAANGATDATHRKRGRPRKSDVKPTAKPAKVAAPKPVKAKGTKESRRTSSGGSGTNAGAAVAATAVPPVEEARELSLAEELDEMPTDLILRENALLIDAIKELQGIDVDKAVQLQQQLQFNLVYLLSCDHRHVPMPASASSATASTRPSE